MSNLENIRRIHLLETERKQMKYTCIVCGVKDLPYSQVRVLNYIHFNDGDPSCWISMDGDGGMIVCSEQCRKQYAALGMASYRSLMKESYQETSILPERHLRDQFCRLENWKTSFHSQAQEFYRIITEWLENSNEGWLFLGTVGSGKTSLACCVAHEFRKLEKKVKFVYGSELEDEIKVQESLKTWDIPKQREAFFAKYLKNDLLIVDEIAQLSWKEPIVETLITRLHAECKTVIFTTNFTLDQIKKLFTGREYLLSRIQQMTHLLTFKESDIRRKTEE